MTSKSPYARYKKKEYRYPNRERVVCACGGIIFKGLNDGSPGAIMEHTCLGTKRPKQQRRNRK